jgi:hypothetical protein
MNFQSKCVVCNKKSTKICSKCKKIDYCSKQCQISDWPLCHKFFCESLPFPSRQIDEKSIHGFLLEVTGNIKIVKVKINNESPDFNPFFGHHSIGQYTLPRKPYIEQNLENSLKFSFRDNFFNDGSISNKCIKNITNNKNNHDWRGSMLVIKIKGLEGEFPCKYIDIEMKDIQDIKDFLIWYGSIDAKKQAAINEENFIKMFRNMCPNGPDPIMLNLSH